MGRAQLVWSRGRRDAEDDRGQLWNRVLSSRGDSAQRSNEELADERLEGDVLVTISRRGWKCMLRNPIWLRQLLNLEELEPAAVLGWLRLREVEVVENFYHPI